MHELTALLLDDMKPALGVTEPGAIAFAVAKAKSYTSGELVRVNVAMNSGMYKNAFTCGIPGSEKSGSVYSAAFGYVAGDPDKGLESLDGMTAEENELGKKLVDEGKVTTTMSGITSRIFIEATVETENDTAVVTIRDSHTHIVSIKVNGEVVFEDGAPAEAEEMNRGDIVTGSIRPLIENKSELLIHRYTLKQLIEYVNTVDIDEIGFIAEAFRMNMDLLRAGLESDKTTFSKYLLDKNDGDLFSRDELTTAHLLCGGAIEARVVGLDRPAMSITGSGAHGIIATMPLYAAYKVSGCSEKTLLRATALSYLICTYIKEYSGKLSAFCGCAIAAGTGMACGLAYMRGGTTENISRVINNMAASITGMICDGGNQGCTMKGIAATDAAFRSVDFAMNDVYIYSEHSIIGKDPEETMRNIGLIAVPGMVGTEKTIVEIFEDKLS